MRTYFESHIVEVTIVAIAATLIIIATVKVGDRILPHSSNEYQGQVVYIAENGEYVEVQIDNKGPRVYVSDFGDYNLEDVRYGDHLKMKLVDRLFVVTAVE